MTTTSERFRELHQSGMFVMPNPWDRGSARVLADMGFPAVATTSAGFGRSIGKDDQEVTRAELVQHVAELVSVIDIPLNVDSERLFPDDPGGIDESVRLLADAGAAGCSIEDYDPIRNTIVPLDEAVAAVRNAAIACGRHGLVLTARAENHLYGATDVDDTIARLVAYRDAGAEVLYSPGLTTADDIARSIGETGRPINVLPIPGTPSLDALADLGVRRISTGSLLHNAAMAALQTAAGAYRRGE